MTVKELYKECENLLVTGLGDKEIMVSNDDGGNGFHHLFYSFITEQNEIDEILGSCSAYCGYGLDDANNFVLLG